MNPTSEIARLRTTLRGLYEQWRQITEAEGNAISTGQWVQVESLQKAKYQLQTLLDTAKADLHAACRACGRTIREVEQEFHSLIEDLIALEARNHQTLIERRCVAIGEEQRLQQAVQKLRQIRSAYASPTQAQWESYL